MSKRRVAVITGSRSEYGLLFPIMKRIRTHPSLELLTIVTGMHLSPQYGLSSKQIENDGFRIDAKIDMLIDADTNLASAKAAGIGMYGISQAIENLNPDIILVYGDRVEALIGAFAGAIAGIPVAHVQGGDMVHGIHIDDSIRNAITRFAHIHFAVFPSHKQRLINMGEQKSRIFTVGFPGWEEIQKVTKEDLAAVTKELGIGKDEKYFVIILHPTTLESSKSRLQIISVLNAVLSFQHKCVVIYPNSDSGSKEILATIHTYAKNPLIIPVSNLERRKYLALLGNAIALVGNSSSMIFDAPTLGVPSLSIGWRQKGRLTHRLIHETSDFDEGKIRADLMKLINAKRILRPLKMRQLPSERIVRVLAEVQIDKKLLMKDLTF